MALDHQSARAHVVAGFQKKFGRNPTQPEAQLLQAVGALETGYGTGWKTIGFGSFNMGAITAGSSWKGKTFEHRDSYPDENGTNHWYVTKFRKYATAADGWEDLANIVYEDRPSVLKAASSGDAYGVSVAMYETGYYRGFGKNAQERIANHHKVLMRNLVAQCRALGEPLPNGEDLPRPTLKRGSTGDAVKELQRLLGLVADGVFGVHTEVMVKTKQNELGLKVDGIVGSKSWAALLAAEGEVEEKVAEVSLTDLALALRDKAARLRDDLNEFIDTPAE